MAPPQITATLLVIVLATLIVYDVFAILAWGRPASISEVVFTYSRQFPAIPLAAGFLLGHLFWSQWIR